MKTIRAVFEKGVFMPQDPVSLAPGTSVHLNITEDSLTPKPWMASFGCMSRHDTDEMMQAVEDAFEQIRPDEWR